MSGNPQPALRLGFLYPGHSAEDDYPRMGKMLCPAVGIDVVHTAIGEDAHREDALRDMGDLRRILEGAKALRDRSVAAAMWACTSGSFVFGWEGANEQVSEIEGYLGVPVSSTSIAFVAALRVLSIDSVAISATYPEDVTRLLEGFLRQVDIETVHSGSLGIPTGVEVGSLKKEDVIRLVSRNDHPEAEAILVPDTALHTAGWIDDLEQAVNNKLVLTANQVTMWQALRLAGWSDGRVEEGLGSLFKRSSQVDQGAN